MPTHYVDSAAVGANNGTSWTDAWTSLASATGAAAGDTVLVDDGHSENPGASFDWNFSSGTWDNPVKIICVDKADDSLSSGATIALTNTAYNASFKGNLWVYGITIDVDRNIDFHRVANSLVRQYWENCNFVVNFPTETSTVGIFFGVGSSYSGEFFIRNCTISESGKNANTWDWIRIATSSVTFDNLTLVFSGTPTRAVFQTYQSQDDNPGSLKIINSDLSGIPGELFDHSNATDAINVIVSSCKLPTSLTYETLQVGDSLSVQNCDDGTITVPSLGLTEYANTRGTVKSTLSKYRTGGADDGAQANAYSWEMAANANALEIYSPLESPPIVRWVAADATPTGATAQGLFQSTRCAPLATPAALTTDSGSTWNGTGVSTKQKIDVTIGDYTLTVYVASGTTLNNDDFWVEVSAPDQVGGPVTVRAFLAKPSTTVYLCPKIEVA